MRAISGELRRSEGCDCMTAESATSSNGVQISKLQRAGEAMPVCVAGVDRGRSGVDVFSMGSAYLGPSATPFMVVGDPSSKEFKVENIGLTPDMENRIDDRVHLLKGMDNLRRDMDRSGLMDAMDSFGQRARAATEQYLKEASNPDKVAPDKKQFIEQAKDPLGHHERDAPPPPGAEDYQDHYCGTESCPQH